jgi:CHAT domain-containing protein
MLPSASTLALLRHETRGRAASPKLVAVLADPVFDSEDVRVRRALAGATDSEKQSTEKDSALLRSVEETGMASGKWPLPRLLGTRREAQRILSLAPAQAKRQALDFEASRETALGSDLGHYQIIHFATHGLINNRHPELSGLVLSLADKQGRPQNGFLRLNEIYNLRLPVELVVLSACQTGLGKEVRGEGLIGLTRGFMYAGARRLAASLWQVEDAATSELMALFYRGMLGEKRLRPASALRAAQLEMWKQKQWRSPYYWAAFVIQGEWK